MSEELFRTHVAVKSIDENERTVDYVASSEAVDSYGEIVEQDWIFDRFAKNPAVLYGHNRHADGGWLGSPYNPKLSFPIGRALEWDVIGKGKRRQLRIKVQFATRDLNELADDVFRNVAAGFLNGGSVGFYPHDVRREKHDDLERYVLSQNELIEFSPVPLGANPDAVVLVSGTDEQVQAFLEKRKAHRDLLEKLATRTDPPALQLAARSTPNTESDMDPKELEAQLAEANAKVEKLSGELKSKTDELESQGETHTTEVASLKEANEALTAELTSTKEKMAQAEKDLLDEKAKSEKLDEQLVSLEVDKYIGKKITPAEREQAIADRKRDGSKAFDERMSRRPDLNLTTTITPAEKVHTTTAATNHTAGSKLAEGMRAVEHKA